MDKRSTVVALAEALRVSVSELTGQPYPPVDPAHERATAQVPAIRAGLVALSYGDVATPGGTVASAARVADQLSLSRRDCDYAAAAAVAAGLVAELAGHAVRDHQARRLLVLALHDVAFVLKHLGYADLAYQAAGQCAQAAADAEDAALIGLSEYTRLQVLPPESRPLGQRLAARAIDLLGARLQTVAAQQVYGMLHLTAGWADALAGRGDDAQAHLAEAQAVAVAVGEPVDGGFGRTNFGPANVAQWRASIAIENGAAGRAVELAAAVDTRAITAPSRLAAFHIDRGNALAQVRRDRDALLAFLAAERTAPQRVRVNPTVRESIGAMLRRARASSGGEDLRTLAARVGLA